MATSPMMSPTTCGVGLIGLAVMGQNPALNMADHGFKVAVYTCERVDRPRGTFFHLDWTGRPQLEV